DLVVRELGNRSVNVLRCNTERASDWAFELRPGVMWSARDPSGRTVLSESTLGVWWRRPVRPFALEEGRSIGQDRAANEQWQAFLEGFASITGPRWISEPAAIRSAEDKPGQLALAQELGLKVPETLITNRPSAAASFIKTTGDEGIAKTVTAAFWEEEGRSAF